MEDIALGVTVFKRASKLENLLESIDPNIISTVHVADDGESTELKEEIYSREYQFKLIVHDLPYDSGLGYGRNQIVCSLEEDFLLILDSDMKMPKQTPILYDQLQERSDVGGICGLFIEHNRIYTSCCDLYEENGTIIQDIRNEKEIESVAGAPYVEFEFITNAALFRRACLEDYSWDPNYVIGREHIDFYVGHMKNTDWKFGICPEVMVWHDPGGSNDYLANRYNEEKNRSAEDYFLQKWGYSDFRHRYTKWIDTYDAQVGGIPPHSTFQRMKAKYEREGLKSVIKAGYSEYLKP